MSTRRVILMLVFTLLGIFIGLVCAWPTGSMVHSVLARRHRPQETKAEQIMCSLRQLRKSTFCPDHDQGRWLKIKGSAEWEDNGGEWRGWLTLPKEAKHEGATSPSWMCDKLPVNLLPWETPSLDPSDLAVAVFSGTSLLHSRANAMMDGWLNRLDKRYIFDRLGEATTPITTLRTRFKSWLAPHESQNAEILAMFGLQQLYEDFPDAKWYIVIGDDTYVHIDYALRALQNFDGSQPHWLTYGGIYPGDLSQYGLTNFTAQAWPKWHGQNFVWTSGAQSFFLSNPMVRDYAAHLATFMETFGNPRKGHVPDVLTGALLTMLGHRPKLLYETPQCSDHYALDGISGDHPRTCMEWSCYHYVRPRRMLAIDQRAQHEKLDRLQNAGDAVGILHMFRAFLNEHYATLRKKQIQVAMLAHKAGLPLRVFDIPVPDQPNMLEGD